MNRIKFIIFQFLAIILYIDIHTNFLNIPNLIIEKRYNLALVNFLIQVAIMVALSMLLAPKPKQPQKLKPISLEQFDIPTAEEGRPIQVLFGKKYVMASNVVWYGHLKSQQVMG